MYITGPLVGISGVATRMWLHALPPTAPLKNVSSVVVLPLFFQVILVTLKE